MDNFGMCGLLINGVPLDTYEGAALLDYSVGETSIKNETFQGINRSTWHLLKSIYGLRKITLTIVFTGPTRRAVTLQRSKLNGALFGASELFISDDGFFYDVTVESCGPEILVGEGEREVKIKSEYTFTGTRRDALVSETIPGGGKIFCKSTMHFTDARLKTTVGGTQPRTFSGPVVTFEKNPTNVLTGLSAAINPIQNFNGYDSPWPAGGGVNLLPSGGAFDTTKNGIRFVSDGKGTYTITGTATADAYYDFSIAEINTLSTVYIHMLNNVSTYSVAFGFFNGNTQITAPTPVPVNAIKDVSATLGGKTVNKLRLFVANGYTANLTFSPMLCVDNTVKPFSPYSNICPISGWTGAKVYVSPTTDPADATVYTIDLDGTRYGGTLDVLAGKLTVTDGYIASYNGETLPSTWISDRDVYAAGTTPTTGAEVVYKLASPFEIDLTETEVELLTGTNNIWSDTGDVTVTIGNEIPTPYPLGGAIFPSVSNGDVLVFDGIDGKITKNGANAAASVNWTEFPQLFPGENTITCPDDVTVEYYPTYI